MFTAISCCVMGFKNTFHQTSYAFFIIIMARIATLPGNKSQCSIEYIFKIIIVYDTSFAKTRGIKHTKKNHPSQSSHAQHSRSHNINQFPRAAQSFTIFSKWYREWFMQFHLKYAYKQLALRAWSINPLPLTTLHKRHKNHSNSLSLTHTYINT